MGLLVGLRGGLLSRRQEAFDRDCALCIILNGEFLTELFRCVRVSKKL